MNSTHVLVLQDNGDAERSRGWVGGRPVNNSTVGAGGGALGTSTPRRSEDHQLGGLLPAQRSPLRDSPPTPLRMATILVDANLFSGASEGQKRA